MLELRGIALPYAIERPLDLTLVPGESVALVGPNGAGKTTLMRCISGQQPTAMGSIMVNGEAIQDVDAQRRARLVGFLPQIETRLSGFTVREVVALGCYARRSLFGSTSQTDDTLIEESIKSVGLSDLMDRHADTLSGGEYQRVRIARTLTQSPELMLLDEPLAHLDPGQSHRVAALIANLSRRGEATSLTALHDLNLAALYFDRIILISDGVIIADGKPNEVMKESLLNAVYQTGFQVISHPSTGRPQVLGLGVRELNP